MSEAGRARFDEFPELISDDGFARLQFSPDERVTVESAHFEIRAPASLRDVIRVKTRSQKGIVQLHRLYPDLRKNDQRDYGSSFRSLLREPRLWMPCLVYLCVVLVTKARAYWMNYIGGLGDWERDESSRSFSERSSEKRCARGQAMTDRRSPMQEDARSPRSTLGDQVKSQMNRPDIHDVWESTYRTTGNERFFEQCYDHIVGIVGQPPGARALDIGGGIGANAIRLARRGYRVDSCDYSEAILERARENVRRHGLAEQIEISRQDVTDLRFPDASFDLTLCWGVLMHIPEVDDALSQLVRVTSSGGYLVFEEINAESPEARLNRIYWRAQSAFREKKIDQVNTGAGTEHSVDFRGEKLFWRQIRLSWLIGQLDRRQCRLIDVRAGMFTELHLRLPAALQRPFDAWNRVYQRNLGWTPLAKHTVLIFQKR